MPKLFQINVTANWGSHGKIAEDIGFLAQNEGWESYIAYGRSFNISSSNLIRIGGKKDVLIHAAQSMLFDKHGLASVNATKQLVRDIEDIQPDIIQLHNIHGYYINYPILFEFLSKFKRPVVWTLHDCWPITGHCAYFTYQQCDKWKNGCYNCENKTEYPRRYLFDRSELNYSLKKKWFKSVDNLTLITVSDWLNGIIGESFLSDIKRLTIHNGINLNVFKKTDSYFKDYIDKRVVLGVCSFWDRRKGLSDIIKLRDYLDDSFIIILIGLSDKQKKILPAGIVGIERTNNVQELVSYYSRADVFINTTYEDNFPTTNLESLACGTPVVTYRTGGSPEAIDDRTGITVDTGDIKCLAQAVYSICDSSMFRLNCRKRAELLFDRNNCYKQYLQLYKSLI